MIEISRFISEDNCHVAAVFRGEGSFAVRCMTNTNFLLGEKLFTTRQQAEDYAEDWVMYNE